MTTGRREYFYLGTDPRDRRSLFWLDLREGASHIAIWGSSGAGKSHGILDMVGQHAMAGRGLGLIDPKGDTFQDVLAALAATPDEGWRRLADDLIIIDPADPACTTSFNPLEVASYASPSRVRAEVVTIFRMVWKLDEAQAPRLGLVIRRSVQLAMENSMTLCELPRLLTDGDLRSRLVDRSADESLRIFWTREFPNSPAAQAQWTASTLTRLETLLDDPAVRRLVGRPKSSFDFRKAMDEGKIVLINLAKGRLGQESAYLLGGFLLTAFQLAAESRQEIFPPESRRMFYLFVDEFQNFATQSFQELLAESRGYGLSLVMANQHLAQLDESLRQAILSNARIRIAFRLSNHDAAVVAPEFWRFDGKRVKETKWDTLRLGRLQIPIPEAVYASAGDETRANREALHLLPDRHMYVHVQGDASPVLLRTVDMPRDQLAATRDRIPELKALAYPAPDFTQEASVQRSAPRSDRKSYEWAGREEVPTAGISGSGGAKQSGPADDESI